MVNFVMLARRIPHSLSRNSFPCILLQPLASLFSPATLSFQSLTASFCKNRGVGIPLQTRRSSGPGQFSMLSLPPWQSNLLALCFHNLTNPFSHNSFYFTSIQNPRGCTLREPVLRPRRRPCCAFSRICFSRIGRAKGHQKRRAMYSRIMCFQYGQSCPPSGPQLSSEWRMPFPARISERRYEGPEFSHCPVPVAI
jgi:hypothetical protein